MRFVANIFIWGGTALKPQWHVVKAQSPDANFRFILLHRLSSSYVLLGRTRSWARCWAAIRLSRHLQASGHALHREVDALDSEGKYFQRSALLRLTHKSQKGPCPICISRNGNRQLRPTRAVPGRAIPGGCVPMSGVKVRSLVAFSNHFHITSVTRPERRSSVIVVGWTDYFSEMRRHYLGTSGVLHMVPSFPLCVCDIYFIYFKVWTRHEVHRAQAHTVCTTQIDKNRHRTFYNGVVVEPQDHGHFLNTIFRSPVTLGARQHPEYDTKIAW